MRRGTREYVKSSYWTTLNQRCINGANFTDTPRNKAYKKKAVLLEITKAQFSDWVDASWSEFERLYADGKTPSIDRIDNTVGYRLGNIAVIDLKENMRKDRNKPVIRTDIFTGDEVMYASARLAALDGYDWGLISRACAKKYNHKGNAWRFAE